MKFTFAATLLAAIASAKKSSETMSHAAVIVAGSTGFSNYRHQADAAHAYQIMVANGIPEENIILMMYDDVASSFWNPFPGELYNKPNGTNVYNQTAISYSGADVTPENFLAVLKNDADTATGPVLNTDENSKIFVNFVDHGAPGFICFPSEYLYADDIQSAVDYMQTNSLYGEMVFYIEACESGSMFPDLTSDQDVYAMTASDASQSSWAAYCPPDDVINGTEIGSCLGDLFSVNWMEDSESHNPESETIRAQHFKVKRQTDESPVCEFGDLTIKQEKLADFQGDLDETVENMLDKVLRSGRKEKKSFSNTHKSERPHRGERIHKEERPQEEEGSQKMERPHRGERSHKGEHERMGEHQQKGERTHKKQFDHIKDQMKEHKGQHKKDRQLIHEIEAHEESHQQKGERRHEQGERRHQKGERHQIPHDEVVEQVSNKGTKWNSRDVQYLWLVNLAEKQADNQEVQEMLAAEIQHREAEEELFKTVFGDQGDELVTQPTDFDCLRTLVQWRELVCGKFSDHSLQYVRHLVHACETQSQEEIDEYATQMRSHCMANSALF